MYVFTLFFWGFFFVHSTVDGWNNARHLRFFPASWPAWLCTYGPWLRNPSILLTPARVFFCRLFLTLPYMYPLRRSPAFEASPFCPAHLHVRTTAYSIVQHVEAILPRLATSCLLCRAIIHLIPHLISFHFILLKLNAHTQAKMLLPPYYHPALVAKTNSSPLSPS